MKLLLTDQSSNSLLYTHSDIRVLSALKASSFDTNILPLLPGMHKDFYHTVNLDFIMAGNYRLRQQKLVDFIPSEELCYKKLLIMNKANIVKILFNCVDVVRYQNSVFIDDSVSSIVSNLNMDSLLLVEYAYVREIEKEESLKELQLKNTALEINLIKAQAATDKFIEKLFFVKRVEDLNSIRDEIINTFFRI